MIMVSTDEAYSMFPVAALSRVAGCLDPGVEKLTVRLALRLFS